MSTLNIPSPIMELITNLSVIGLIDKEQKLNINTMSFSPASTWGQAVYRYYYRESRNGLVEFLKSTLAQTILAIQDYKDTEFCKIIINHLALTKPGIQNLAVTYANDPNILSQLNVILENIDIQLSKNKKLLDPNFKSCVVQSPLPVATSTTVTTSTSIPSHMNTVFGTCIPSNTDYNTI